MNSTEYRAMARVERHHWWYLGLRDALERSLKREDLALRAHPKVLDAGCGTGENLRFLRELLDPSYLGGFDVAEEALGFARQKAPDADIYRSDIRDPTIRVHGLDLVLSLDVIYIPGVERCIGGLHRLVAHVRTGGLLVLNLPAYDWLYSEHDVALRTSERFTAGRVRRLLERLGLSVELLTYRLFFLFPAVVLARLPGMLRAHLIGGPARSDLHALPHEALNRILYAILKAENSLIERRIHLPWGSSVLAVGRKISA